MPILLLGILALFGFGYWEYKRGAFGLKGNTSPKGLPPPMPSNATPQQVVTADAPGLANEILDLLYNGRDPRAMHAVASELEKDGFFDAAAILHNRANELEAARVPQGAPPPPFGPPPNQQGGGGIPPGTVPGTPAPQGLDAAVQEIRNEIGRLDNLYGGLDKQIRTLPSDAGREASWNTAITSWRRFALDFERMSSTPRSFETPGVIVALRKSLDDFRTTLATWQAEYAAAAGLAGNVPQQAPAGPSIVNQAGPQRNVPFQAPALSDFGPLGRGGARGRG